MTKVWDVDDELRVLSAEEIALVRNYIRERLRSDMLRDEQ